MLKKILLSLSFALLCNTANAQIVIIPPSSSGTITTSSPLSGNGSSGSPATLASSVNLTIESVSLNVAGVKLSAADGVLTLLGLGNGSDESLSLDLDNTSNILNITSSTGVQSIFWRPSSAGFIGVVAPDDTQAALYAESAFAELFISSPTGFIDIWSESVSAEISGVFGSNEFNISSENNNSTLSLIASGGAEIGLIASNTTSQVKIGADGVFLTGAAGLLTILGNGAGSDEDLTLNLDSVSNTVTATSSTGVTLFNFSGITVKATGYQSSDGSTGFTGAACTSFKNGLCVTGT